MIAEKNAFQYTWQQWSALLPWDGNRRTLFMMNITARTFLGSGTALNDRRAAGRRKYVSGS